MTTERTDAGEKVARTQLLLSLLKGTCVVDVTDGDLLVFLDGPEGAHGGPGTVKDDVRVGIAGVIDEGKFRIKTHAEGLEGLISQGERIHSKLT